MYRELLDACERDPNVVGLVLGGSRGKRAYVDDRSDYDVYIIVGDSADEYRRRFAFRRGDPVEGTVFSVDEFRAHAAIGSPSEWNRYTFAHVEPELDKLDGEIAAIVEEKGALPRDGAPERAAEALDSYVNAYYRSAKNARLRLSDATRLDAAESIPALLVALFALENKVRPYNKWLAWELEHHPLPCAFCAGDDIVRRTVAIVAIGDLELQQAMFRDVERHARDRGHGDVLDGWEPDLALLRGGAVV